MRARVYSTLMAAQAARHVLDRASGYPVEHPPGSYRIASPGRAAARLREAGVRTEHAVDVIAHPRGNRFAIQTSEDDAEGEQLDESWREAPPR